MIIPLPIMARKKGKKGKKGKKRMELEAKNASALLSKRKDIAFCVRSLVLQAKDTGMPEAASLMRLALISIDDQLPIDLDPPYDKYDLVGEYGNTEECDDFDDCDY